ncbi:hypothetical protein WUBG_11383 [Wuchereria bancrofti]|uniref:Uncharacterized protein n=1 Tax=Wuchereria bancrofti TaxID=6293 RepID=J9E6D3_WUCBA|nr:hypothetical protein WUBG_11383 [Wuchereria bancrofti]
MSGIISTEAVVVMKNYNSSEENFISENKNKKNPTKQKKRSRKNRLAERKRVTVTSTTRSTTTNSSQLLRNYSMLCHHQKMNRIDVGNRTLPSTINVRMSNSY